ncbi:hypothetical protein [Thermodesulfovibrio yellowstonii]|uniref:hypothetical protein n=1 Tax=Thermodesulfovibrio yellowstonii TaxID=28262 RepID=UPI0024B3A869|nr:hypothetical protein [Thermodesulfovibrio yellowstonii]MDI6865788.1 hypothetical protein [Thermodesulfovibrio yellowstonii]
MATIMGKLKKKEAQEQAAEIIVKIGKDKRVINDRELLGAVECAVGFMRTLKEIEPQYRVQKEIIAKKAKTLIDDKGTVTFIVDTEEWGVVECKVTFQYEAVIPEDRVEVLKGILGGRFNDLVRVKTTYYATPKLIELATDGDRGKDIAECIVVKEKAAQISFK